MSDVATQHDEDETDDSSQGGGVPEEEGRQRHSRRRRFAAWHRGLATANKIALYALLATALAAVYTPAVDLYRAVFPSSLVALLVEEGDDPCMVDWIVTPGNEHIPEKLTGVDSRKLDRWQQEGRVVHAKVLRAWISVRGNANAAVSIRELSITVVRREDPVAGRLDPAGPCGGPGDDSEHLVVDLDTLPMGKAVPVRYLQQSPRQKEARGKAAELGNPMTLPHEVTTDDFYSFSLTGRTQQYDCAWYATLTWWDGQEVHHDRIDDDGRPFRVSAEASAR